MKTKQSEIQAMPLDKFLFSVLRGFVETAAMCAAYPSWSDEFARSELTEAWLIKPSLVGRQFTAQELQTLPVDTLRQLGFNNWDDVLTLIPLWAYNYIRDGEVLTSITGDTKIKGTDTIDLDVRFGNIAYGFMLESKPG